MTQRLEIIIDFGQDERGLWYWRCNQIGESPVEGGPYRTAEDAERAATAVLLPEGCKIINSHREIIGTRH